MEVRWEIFLIIIGSALVTFLPRVIPLMVLSRFELPGWAMRWLHYVPISVMAALIGQELLLHDGQLAGLRNNIELFAALPTFFVAIKTRSLLGTVVVGVISTMVLRFCFAL
ncbi:AzlD domain-containing protein [Brevibacillus fluminis]|uniref:AzlD domain-containing protein n=1 Tax=Brevibacillus fluminis TaxID=511487 RepID=UPI003F8939DE